MDELIAAGQEPPLPAGAADPADPGQQVLDEELKAALRREIQNLPPRMRRALELHVYHDLEVTEVGLAMSTSPETVKAHLYQARKRLQEKLDVHFAGPGFLDEEDARGDPSDDR